MSTFGDYELALLEEDLAEKEKRTQGENAIDTQSMFEFQKQRVLVIKESLHEIEPHVNARIMFKERKDGGLIIIQKNKDMSATT
jgi:hypothetical protein